ncbi:MAG: hypothetical protein D6724_08820 [Armatimonadetes bacterium]|nr:MAG: hypothetical protein D6724_08820 [Armatimonadota bacterium]
MLKDGECPGCRREPGFVKIILFEDAPLERERIIWRKPHNGEVFVAGKRHKVVTEPLVVGLPTSRWIRTRA